MPHRPETMANQMSQSELNQTSDAEIADSRRHWLYKLGGAGTRRTVKEYDETREYVF
jgi:hypothetical protein